MRRFIAAAICLVLSLTAATARWPHGGGTPTAPVYTANAIYPIPQANYTCVTTYYVDTVNGSDSNTATQAQTKATAWKTIAKATTGSTVFGPGVCITVEPTGVYSENVTLLNSNNTAGTANNATGFAVLRCDTATPPNPALYRMTGGAQGANPACKINGTGATQLGGIVATSNGTQVANYVIVDGFEIYSQVTSTASVTGLSYNAGTGICTLTLGSNPNLQYQQGFTVSGLTGTGSIASCNGYFFSQTLTAGTTLAYQTNTGLSMGYTSGGTVTYASGSDVGIGPGPSNPNPNGHHVVFLRNLVHDVGGSGISTLNSDNIIMWENAVYNTSWTNPYDESGLDMVANKNATYTASTWDNLFGTIPTGGATIRNVIANSVSDHNGNSVSPQSDGNGIIIDTLAGAQTSCLASASAYSYGTLIYGSVSFNNGGKGIHLFYSSNVAIINNTTYSNSSSTLNLGTGRPEIDFGCGSNNYAANNATTAVIGTGSLADNFNAGSGPGATVEVGNQWQNNVFYTVGTPPNCAALLGYLGSGVVCYNGLDAILNPVSAPAAWASGTTYAQYALVLGSNNHVYASIGAGNLGNNPVTDGGVHWQDDGLANNSYPTNPVFSNTSLQVPILTPGNGSPLPGAGTAAVTSLGGYNVSTPNIGAY